MTMTLRLPSDSDLMDQLYREYIIDHYKNPRNFGELEPHDAEFHDRNPVCGDEIGVHIRLDGDRIADLRFHGQGCAISQAVGVDHLRRAEGQDRRRGRRPRPPLRRRGDRRGAVPRPPEVRPAWR